MFFQKQTTVASVCLALFFLICCLPTFTRADKAIHRLPHQWAMQSIVSKDIRDLDLKVMEALKIIAENRTKMKRADIEKVKSIADEGLIEMGRVKIKLEAIFDSILDEIETQGRRDLKKIQEKYYSKIRAIHGGNKDFAGHKQSAIAQDDGFEAIFTRVNPSHITAIRMHIMEGGAKLKPVIKLFELCAYRVRMASIFLALSHSYAYASYVAKDKNKDGAIKFPNPRPAWDTFLMGTSLLQDALNFTQFLFPKMPSLKPVGLRDESGKLDEKAADKFINTFASFHKNILSKRDKDTLWMAFAAMEDGVYFVETYRRQAFGDSLAKPPSQRAKDLMALSVKMMQNPNYSECFALARGVVTTDKLFGPPCDGESLQRDLEKYVKFHRTNPGFGIYKGIMNRVIQAKVEAKRGRVSVAKVRNAVSKWFLFENFTPQIKANREQVLKDIFGDRNAIKTALPNGLKLHRLVSSALKRNGIDPMLGQEAKFDVSVAAAQDVLKGLKFHKVVHPGKRIKRVGALSACEWATEEDKRHEAPYAVISKKVVPVNAKKLRWTYSIPSSHSARQVVFAHKAIVDRIDKHQVAHFKDDILAGALRYQFLKRALVALVWIKRMRGESIRDKTLKGLGISFSEKEIMDIRFRERYHTPDWNTIIREADFSFEKIVDTFAETYAPEVDRAGEPIPKPFVIPEGTKRPQIEALLRKRYAQELGLAIDVYKEVKKESDEFDIHKAADESKFELCRILRLTPEFCGFRAQVIVKQLEGMDGVFKRQIKVTELPGPGAKYRRKMMKEVNQYFISELIRMMEDNMLQRRIKREWKGRGKDIKDNMEDFWREYQTLRANFYPTADELVEEIVAHKGAIGFTKSGEHMTREWAEIYTSKLTVEERDRYHMYRTIFSGGHLRGDKKGGTRTAEGKLLYEFFATKLTALAQLYDNSKAAFDGKKRLHKRMLTSLEYLFPVIGVEVDFPNYTLDQNVYEVYDKSDSHFKAAMKGFEGIIVGHIHDIMREDDAEEIHEELGQDIPALDAMLTEFPDLKQIVCEVYEDWEWSALRTAALMTMLEMAASSTFYGGLIVGAAITLYNINHSIGRHRHVGRARTRQLAIATQHDPKTFEKNQALVNYMEEQAYASWTQVALDGLFWVGYAGRLGKAAKGLGSAFGREVRYYKAVYRKVTKELAESAAKNASKNVFHYMGRMAVHHTKVALKMMGAFTYRTFITHPGRWRLLQKSNKLSLVQRLNEPIVEFGEFAYVKNKYFKWLANGPIWMCNWMFRRANSVIRWANSVPPKKATPFGTKLPRLKSMRRFTQANLAFAGWFKDRLMDPFVFFGKEFTNRAAVPLTGLLIYGIGHTIWAAGDQVFNEVPTQATMSRLYQDRERYARFWKMVDDETITEEQIPIIIQLDDELRVKYLNEVKGWVGEQLLERVGKSKSELTVLSADEIKTLEIALGKLEKQQEEVKKKHDAEKDSMVRVVLKETMKDQALLIHLFKNLTGN